MAPEQLAGLRSDALADQFSFCVCVHEALFGSRPFVAASPAELHARILAGEREPIPGNAEIPARIHAAIVRSLEAEPSKRWPDMGALLSELEQALAPRQRARAYAWGLAGIGAVAVGRGGVAVVLELGCRAV